MLKAFLKAKLFLTGKIREQIKFGITSKHRTGSMKSFFLFRGPDLVPNPASPAFLEQ